jgi:hypothetical protein
MTKGGMYMLSLFIILGTLCIFQQIELNDLITENHKNKIEVLNLRQEESTYKGMCNIQKHLLEEKIKDYKHMYQRCVYNNHR